MKKILAFISMISCLGILLFLTSCISQSHYSLIADGALYAKLEQTITVKMEDDQGNFDSSISKDNMTISNSLAGKSITNVEYVNSKEIHVTFQGTLANTTDSEYEYLSFEIKGGMGHDSATVSVVVYQKAPQIYTTSNSIMGSKTNKTCASIFELSYGEFNEANVTLENFILKDSTGTLSVSMSNGRLSISVSGYDATDNAYPTVTIKACVTSFNANIDVTVGHMFSKEII